MEAKDITLKDIKNGDCFAYKIENDSELKGRYFILCVKERKVFFEEKFNYSFIYLKITSDDVLPKSSEDIEALEDVIVDVTPMEMRFFPFDKNSVEQTIKERSKVKVYPDELGFLHTYTFRTNLTRKEYIQNMKYLGNFDINYNAKEFLPFDSINLPYISMKNIELKASYYYKAYNLKKGSIWQQTEEERKQTENKWNRVVEACGFFGTNDNSKEIELKNGDCFAYKIENDSELNGRYFILCARSFLDDDYNKLYYYFNLKITSSTELPRFSHEIEMLEDIIVEVTPLESRLLKTDLNKLSIENERKRKVYSDEMEYLYTYTFKFLKRDCNFSQNFTYLGNYNIKYPKNEYIYLNPYFFTLFMQDNFVNQALDCYTNNNLRKSKIWHYSKSEREKLKTKSSDTINKIISKVMER